MVLGLPNNINDCTSRPGNFPGCETIARHANRLPVTKCSLNPQLEMFFDIK